LALLVSILATPAQVAGQQLRIALYGAGGDYREQSSALAFDGKGAAGRLELSAGRFGLSVAGSRLSFDRAATAAPDAEAFVGKELEVAGRFRLVSLVGVEVGILRRSVEPDQAAQAIQVAKLGLRGDYPLAPGAEASLRAAYLAGAKFSGGGSASGGVGLGFGLSYGAKRRGARITVDYDFVRVNRETTAGGPVAVPIQSSTARLGLLLLL
jgi:hypothetical protein